MWYPDYLIMVWFAHNIPLYSHKIIILSHKKSQKIQLYPCDFPFLSASRQECLEGKRVDPSPPTMEAALI